jgi:hypothetical protein
MKKTLFTLLAISAVAIAGPRSASAQTNPALVKVPFRFIVGGTVLPAGSYRIASDTQDPSLLVITNQQGQPAATFATVGSADNPNPMDPEVHVAFKNVDGLYFLWRVEMPGSDAREVVITKAQAERTLAKLNLLPEQRGEPTK